MPQLSFGFEVEDKPEVYHLRVYFCKNCHGTGYGWTEKESQIVHPCSACNGQKYVEFRDLLEPDEVVLIDTVVDWNREKVMGRRDIYDLVPRGGNP